MLTSKLSLNQASMLVLSCSSFPTSKELSVIVPTSPIFIAPLLMNSLEDIEEVNWISFGTVKFTRAEATSRYLVVEPALLL